MAKPTQLNEPYTMYRDRGNGLLAAADVVEDTAVEIGAITFEQTAGVQNLGIKAGQRRIVELLNSKGEHRWTTLDGKPLRWILNATNAKRIAELTKSPIPAHWTGRVIVLFPTTHTRSKEEGPVPAIRVRPNLSKHDKGPSPAQVAFYKNAAITGSDMTTDAGTTAAVGVERSAEEIAREFMGDDE